MEDSGKVLCNPISADGAFLHSSKVNGICVLDTDMRYFTYVADTPEYVFVLFGVELIIELMHFDKMSVKCPNHFCQK